MTAATTNGVLTETDYRIIALYLKGGPVEALADVSAAARPLAMKITPPEGVVSGALGGWSRRAAFVEGVESIYDRAGADAVIKGVARIDPLAPAPKSRREELLARLWDDRKVLYADFPEPKWIVQDRLPVGLGYLSGKPKSGKSWLVLQLSQSLGHGANFLGQAVSTRKVLYAALEDHYHRLQNRLKAQMAEPSGNVFFTNEVPPLGEGLLEYLQEMHAEFGFDLIVLDTFSRLVRAGGDQSSNDDMVRHLGPMQQWAVQNGLCVLIIDHKKKGAMDSVDHWEGNSGATQKTAVADFNWSLARDRGSRSAVLRMGGRDITAEWEQDLQWDTALCCWQPQGPARDAGDAEVDGEGPGHIDAVLKAIHGSGGASHRDNLADDLGLDRTNVFRRLKGLERSGLVATAKDGKKVSWVLTDKAREMIVASEGSDDGEE